MPMVKKCAHGRGLTPKGRRAKWRACGCQWYGDVRVNGVRVYLPLGPNEIVARSGYAQASADRLTGKLAVRKPNVRTVEDVARAWWESLAAENPPPRPATLNAYRSRANLISAWFGSGDIRSVTGQDISDFNTAVESKYSVNYARDVRTTFGNVMRYAVARGLIPSVPETTSRKRKRPSPQVERLSIDGANKVIEALTEPLASMAEVALLTGLRRGELLGLTFADVDLERRVLRLREQVTEHGRGPLKTTSSNRVVSLSARAVEIIKVRLALEPTNQVWDVDYWIAGKELRAAMIECGVYRKGRGWHSFRHANAALRDRAGESLRSAAASMGHGARYAQTLAYGWSAESGSADALDAARERPGTSE